MKDLYTIDEIFDKIKSHDYNAEMLLQHLLVLYGKQLEEESQLLEKHNDLISEVCSLREEKIKIIKEKTEALNRYSKHVDMLVGERGEAREEAEIIRALYRDATGFGVTLPW